MQPLTVPERYPCRLHTTGKSDVFPAGFFCHSKTVVLYLGASCQVHMINLNGDRLQSHSYARETSYSKTPAFGIASGRAVLIFCEDEHFVLVRTCQKTRSNIWRYPYDRSDCLKAFLAILCHRNNCRRAFLSSAFFEERVFWCVTGIFLEVFAVN